MNKHYAITDLHGQYLLWEKIKNYCDESDIIYFLGDAIDRGSQGIDSIVIMKELLTDPRVIYIKGNHEDMMYQCGLWSNYKQRIRNPDAIFWGKNGGNPTIHSLCTLGFTQQEWFLNKIKTMPYLQMYQNPKEQNILLCHAGMQPNDPFTWSSDYYWDRKHFRLKWPKDCGYEDWFVVHGHTPVPALVQELNGIRVNDNQPLIPEQKEPHILKYADGHKIDLDLMSFITHTVALFDLDTLEVEKYFMEKENT